MKEHDDIRLKDPSIEKSRITILKFLLIVFPMWLSAKFYNGPYMEFIRTYFNGIILAILLGLLIQFILTKTSEKSIVIAVFIGLTFIQIAHLYVPSLFSGIGFTIGSTTFFTGRQSINLIPYYGVGGFIGFFILKGCRKS